MGASHHDIATAWARQLKPRLTGHNMWFEGDTIYSYGTHFPIATLTELKGVPVALFTTRTYSMSTAHHIGIARRAAEGAGREILRVERPNAREQDHAANYNALMREAQDYLGKARRSIRAELHVARYELCEQREKEAKRYAELFDFSLDTPGLVALNGCDLLAVTLREAA